jgi:hypothetical protein
MGTDLLFPRDLCDRVPLSGQFILSNAWIKKTGAIVSLLHIFSRRAQGQLNVRYLAQYSLLFTLDSVIIIISIQPLG